MKHVAVRLTLAAFLAATASRLPRSTPCREAAGRAEAARAGVRSSGSSGSRRLEQFGRRIVDARSGGSSDRRRLRRAAASSLPPIGRQQPQAEVATAAQRGGRVRSPGSSRSGGSDREGSPVAACTVRIASTGRPADDRLRRGAGAWAPSIGPGRPGGDYYYYPRPWNWYYSPWGAWGLGYVWDPCWFVGRAMALVTAYGYGAYGLRPGYGYARRVAVATARTTAPTMGRRAPCASR